LVAAQKGDPGNPILNCPMSSDKPDTTSPLFVLIQKSENKIAAESLKEYGPLIVAYNLMGNLLTLLVNQGSEEPTSVSESAAKRISLTGGLLQASTCPESLIRSGQYWAAVAVLRQQMEALSRIIRIRNISTDEASEDHKPPNVSVLPMGLSKNYGRLSELVHVSNGELLQSFVETPGSGEVATSIPLYRQDWSVSLLTQHVYQLVVLATEIDLLHRELYPNKELIDVISSLLPVASIIREAV
jgi:hypothetical protein